MQQARWRFSAVHYGKNLSCLKSMRSPLRKRQGLQTRQLRHRHGFGARLSCSSHAPFGHVRSGVPAFVASRLNDLDQLAQAVDDRIEGAKERVAAKIDDAKERVVVKVNHAVHDAVKRIVAGLGEFIFQVFS